MPVPVLSYYDLGDRTVAFSSTRHGGVGVGNYASFNINHYCGDAPDAVRANQEALCRELGISRRQLIYPHQTHQTEVRRITDAFLSLAEEARAELLEGVDALMTDLSGICIGVSTADCIPVLLYDEAHHAVAAVHAGWRGTVSRIVRKTVAAMQAAYHTEAAQLRAVVGPGISLRSFEVDDEVYDAFADAGFPMQHLAQRMGQNGKWHINLPLCNQLQLEEAGVSAANIHQTAVCTYERADDYFSARRLGVQSGRIFTGIMQKG